MMAPHGKRLIPNRPEENDPHLDGGFRRDDARFLAGGELSDYSAARLPAGLATETYRPASSALLTDLVDPKDRVTAFAGYRIAINAGFAFGPAVAGWLAEHCSVEIFPAARRCERRLQAGPRRKCACLTHWFRC